MIKKLTAPQGQFTHVEIKKLYKNGCIDVNMLVISEQEQDGEISEVEQYREHGTSFESPYPFELTADDLEVLNPKPIFNPLMQ